MSFELPQADERIFRNALKNAPESHHEWLTSAAKDWVKKPDKDHWLYETFFGMVARDGVYETFYACMRANLTGEGGTEGALQQIAADILRQDKALSLLAPHMTPEGFGHVKESILEASATNHLGDYLNSIRILADLSYDEAIESQLVDWVDMLEYMRFLGLKLGTIVGIEDIVYSCHAFVPFEDLCILVENPINTSVDEDGHLHHDSEQAYSFKDGWGVSAFHGVVVPRYALLPAESLPADKIENERNIETRRVLIEKYGTARFLRDTKAELIHRDECGELYRKQLFGDEPLVMVCVTDATPDASGKRRQYFLRVPPTITTAKAAVAWSFDMPEDEYRPSVES